MLTSISLVVVFFPQSVGAETSANADYACTIDTYPDVEVLGVEEMGSNSVLLNLRLQNQSQYLFNSVRLAVALYEDASATVPQYWTILKEDHNLPPRAVGELSVVVNAEHVPAGEYVVRAFASQGDFDNLLSASMQNQSDAGNIVLQKNSPQAASLDVEITVNSQPLNGQTIEFADFSQLEIEAITENTLSVPLRDATLQIVVAEGMIPAGTAVSHRKADPIKILPGSKKRTQSTDYNTGTGLYSVYAMLEQLDVFHELQSATLQLGDMPGNTEFLYLTGIGVTERATGGLEVVSCVDRVGGDIGPQLSEGVMLNSSVGAQKEINGSNTDRTLSFLVSGSVAAEGLWVSLATPLVLSDEVGEGETPYQKVDELRVRYTCEGADNCEVYMREPVASDSQSSAGGFGAGSSQSFYFYAGIIIVAALLGYIMLRRLHPDSNLPKKPVDNQPDTELQ